MPAQYQYRCNGCNRLFSTHDRADAMRCPECAELAPRKFSFTTSVSLKEHWNTAVGQYVSNSQQLDDAFKRQSDIASARTGIDHEYVRVDPTDMKDPRAHGVDEDSFRQ